MKYFYYIFFIMSAVFLSCSSGSSNASEDKVFKIGIIQLIEHDALDASYRGFVDGLKKLAMKTEKILL